jgi:hypothetical protein
VKDTDDPLPRMPPFRSQVGLRYQYNAFQIGGNVVAAAGQERCCNRNLAPEMGRNFKLLCNVRF